MRIKDWMTATPITVSPTAPIGRAQQLMAGRRIRHLPVIDAGQLVGILSDRDVRSVQPSPATSFAHGEIRFLLDKLRVSEVMTRSVITVGPDEPLAEAVRLMLDNKIGSVPVVAEGRLVGILTEVDLMRALSTALDHPVPRSGLTEPRDAGEIPPRKILLPLDGTVGSETVVAKVGEIARAEGATVRLLHVAPQVHEIRADDRIVIFADQEAARIEAEVHTYLRRVAATLGDVTFELAVRFGDPIDEIVRDAAEVGVDLIAMATHRRTGFSRLVRGSVAEEVERQTRVPVMLVRYGAAAA